MEDVADIPSPTGSPRQNNNLAQRLSRQFSRSFLPAIRNLVRPNRPRTRVAPEPDSPIINRPLHTSPILPIPTTLSENISFESPPPTRTDSSLICNSPPSNTTTTQEQEADDDLLDPLPPLVEDSSPNETGLQIFNNLGALATLNNLRSDDASEDNSDTNSNTRQRYRLVVYFEERANEEHPTARYVAVIVGRLDELQFLLTSNTNERGFGDVLNNLFNSYQPKGTPPASKDSIDSLPTVTITEQEQSCMICLEKFEQGSTAVVLPCKHTFHGEECVKSWLKMHNSCPICRYELPVEDEEYEAQRKERMVARGFNEDSATESTLSTEDNLQEDNLQLQFEGDEEEEGDHGHHVCDHDHHHHHHDFDDVFVSDENENEDEDVEMLDTDMSVGEENDSVNYLFGDD